MKLALASVQSDSKFCDIELSEDSVHRLNLNYAVLFFYKLTGLSISSVASLDFGLVEGALAAFARLDAFVGTIITCLRAHDLKTAGSCHRKIRIKAIVTYFSPAFAHLAPRAGAYVQYWCQEGLNVTVMSVHDSENPKSDPI